MIALLTLFQPTTRKQQNFELMTDCDGKRKVTDGIMINTKYSSWRLYICLKTMLSKTDPISSCFGIVNQTNVWFWRGYSIYMNTTFPINFDTRSVVHVMIIIVYFPKSFTHGILISDTTTFKHALVIHIHYADFKTCIHGYKYVTEDAYMTWKWTHTCIYSSPLVPHICVRESGQHCADNGLSPIRRQAIISTNAGLLSFEP